MSDKPNRLKLAVDAQPVPAHLAAQIRGSIGPRESGRWWWGGLAVAVVALLTVYGFYRVESQRQEAFFATLRTQVSRLMSVGLGDHLHCAYFRQLSSSSGLELGAEYAALIAAVQARVTGGFRVRAAHKCRYRGRSFVHLILKNEQRLMSVVIAAKQDGEALSADRLVPALVTAGVPIYRQRAGSFEIAAVEDARHLIYLISDLPGDANLQMLQAMAEPLRAALPPI